MSKLAEHVLAVSNKEKVAISNLQLQKIMYFALGDFLKEKKDFESAQKVYTTPFEAWRYGPVIPEDYHFYKKYGDSSILEKGEYSSDMSFLDQHIIKYLKKDVFSMVRDSHKNKFWKQNRSSILEGVQSLEYQFEDLKNDFVE